MDKVLILDRDVAFAQSLKSDLDKSHQFQVEVTTSGKDAIEILENTKIAVLVTELTLPDTDAFELLVHMTRRHPNTPCIIMADPDKHSLKEKVVQREFFSVIDKPFKAGTLLSSIFIALNLRDEGENFQGMNMASIVPLIDVLKKTCWIEIKSDEIGTGYLYHKNGILAEAYCNTLKDEAACVEITTWEKVIIRMVDKQEWQKIIPQQKQLIKNDIAGRNGVKKKASVSALSGKNHFTSVFNKKLRDFKDLSGFLALAIFKQNNEIIASHQSDPDLNLTHIASEMKSLFSMAEDSFTKMNFGPGNSFTFHMAKCTILIVTGNSDSNSDFYMIGVTKQYGNWTYFKTLMRKLHHEIDK